MCIKHGKFDLLLACLAAVCLCLSATGQARLFPFCSTCMFALSWQRSRGAVRSPTRPASPATKRPRLSLRMLVLCVVPVAGVGRLPESVYVDGGNVRYFAFGSNLLRSKMVGCAAPRTRSSQRRDD